MQQTLSGTRGRWAVGHRILQGLKLEYLQLRRIVGGIWPGYSQAILRIPGYLFVLVQRKEKEKERKGKEVKPMQ